MREPEPPSGDDGRRRGPSLFLALAGITFVGPLSVHMFLPALPYVRLAFAVDEGTAQLTFSLSMVAMAVATLCYGSLSDRFGRLPVLVVGMALFAGGAAIGAIAPTIEILIGGRILQGLGAACGMVMARAILRDVYGTARLGQMFAYLTTAYIIGPMLAPPLGGFLTDAFGWQSILIVPAAFGGLGLLIAVAVIGETRAASDTRRVPLLRGYARLLGMPRFVALALNPAFASSAFFSLNVGATYLFIEVMGRDASEYGLYFMLGPLGFVAGNVMSARLSNRLSGNFLVVFGSTVALLGAISLPVMIAVWGLLPVTLFLPAFLMSVGQGLAMPHAHAAAISTDPQLIGTASGIVVFGQHTMVAILTLVVAVAADGTALPMSVCVTAAATASLAAGIAGVLLSRGPGGVR